MLSNHQFPEFQPAIANSLPLIKKPSTKTYQSHRTTVAPPSRSIKRRDKIGIPINQQKTIIQVDEAITTELYQNCGFSGQGDSKMDFLTIINRNKNSQQENKKNNRNNNIQARTQNPELFGGNEELMSYSPKMKIIFKPTISKLTSELKLTQGSQRLPNQLKKNKLVQNENIRSPYEYKNGETIKQFQSLQLLPEKYSVQRSTDTLASENKSKRGNISFMEKLKIGLKEGLKCSKSPKRQMKSASMKHTKFHTIQFSNPQTAKTSKNGSKSFVPLTKYKEIERCFIKNVKLMNEARNVLNSNKKQLKDQKLCVSSQKKDRKIIQISDQ